MSMKNKISGNLSPKIFNILTTSGFTTLFILYFYDLKLAIMSTTLVIFCGIQFICILITLIHGTFLLSIATLVALVVLQPIFDNVTFIALIFISIIAQYAAIRISLQKIGINEKLSNLNPRHMLQITAISAMWVTFAVVFGLFLLESPPAPDLLVFGAKVLVIEFLSPLLMFRALGWFL
jgi:hypothetical protein